MGVIDRLTATPQAAGAVALVLDHLAGHGHGGPEIAPLPAKAAARFDALIDALNRLPRPFAAFGALGLILYALAAPESFSQRMDALSSMPEQLWWLLGAIFSLHFGAREAHHFRAGRSGGATHEGVSSATRVRDGAAHAPAASDTVARPSGADPSSAVREGL